MAVTEKCDGWNQKSMVNLIGTMKTGIGPDYRRNRMKTYSVPTINYDWIIEDAGDEIWLHERKGCGPSPLILIGAYKKDELIKLVEKLIVVLKQEQDD